MEQKKSNIGIKFEEMVLWGSGSQSYFRSLSVTVIPWGVTLKLTVANFLAASYVDNRSTVRCIVLALVSISTSHCPRYISEPTVSRKKNKNKQIKANQCKQIFDKHTYILHTLFFFMRMLFFRPRLNILIFLPILGWKYSCIILKL